MIKTDIKSQLLGTDFFGGLQDEVLDGLIELAVPLQVAKGESIFREGDTVAAIYLLVSGRVEASVSDGQGRKFVFMFNEPGELLGEVSYLDGGPCAWSTVAERESSLLMFRRSDLVNVFGVSDGLPCETVRSKILMQLAAMVRRISTAAKNLALLDVYGRIRILFNQMQVEENGLWLLEKPLTQQEIADQIGSSREMVARILKELVYGHYIRMENRRIVLLKMLPENF
ncbi:CRP-like cAMP-binding protein [Crenobacter luteus]|uniref:Crp/Fnr family transcriptional regulator n=1 Tax=Crenobacter luteus TaxID=1452487 RepID=A0A161R6S4_9NEIS|nr:Crp/Fnr family transcriptional regulator [Crenobacter luteus]KZE31748.1 Crp/Fnr family transcriptional regulator [Crenobacter luteus]TCP15612.1 CRP-like cAMP-binding protein [Crenobacter luteus]